jgi:hypothetical protein
MTDIQIICKFLSPACSAFVLRVRKEWADYMKNPRMHARPGCLKREHVRLTLENIAYRRYAKTI